MTGPYRTPAPTPPDLMAEAWAARDVALRKIRMDFQRRYGFFWKCDCGAYLGATFAIPGCPSCGRPGILSNLVGYAWPQ